MYRVIDKGKKTGIEICQSQVQDQGVLEGGEALTGSRHPSRQACVDMEHLRKERQNINSDFVWGEGLGLEKVILLSIYLVAASLSRPYFHNKMSINKNYFRIGVKTQNSLERGGIFHMWAGRGAGRYLLKTHSHCHPERLRNIPLRPGLRQPRPRSPLPFEHVMGSGLNLCTKSRNI